MEKRFTAAIPKEWIGQKVKVLIGVALAGEIKGVLGEIGADYIIVGQDIINIGYIAKIRKA
jgi:hypothetical protein